MAKLTLAMLCIAANAAMLRGARALGQEPAVPANDEVIIESLRASISQWLERVEFSSTYAERQGRASTSAQGLAGELSPDADVRRVTGVFNRASGIARYSVDYERETQRSAEGNLLNADFEEVATGDVTLVYHPLIDLDAGRGSAFFLPRETGDPDRKAIERFAAGESSQRKVTPLSISGGVIGGYLEAPVDAKSVSRTLQHLDRQSSVVLVEFLHLDTQHERRVEFNLAGSTPVVVKVSAARRYGGKTSETLAVASDFVECPGGPVARTVRAAFHTPATEKSDYPWLVFEWTSKDLGAKPVTPADFRVPLRGETDIKGVSDPSIPMVDGTLDITRVALKHLGNDERASLAGEPASAEGDQPADEPPPPTRSMRRSVLWGNVILGCGIAVSLLWWRWRRRGRSPA